MTDDGTSSTPLNPDGLVYCIDFDPAFTAYQPEDTVNRCADPYGVEFTFVNKIYTENARGKTSIRWDPWFDKPNRAGTRADRLETKLAYYKDANGRISWTDRTLIPVYFDEPPSFCRLPSPGQQAWDKTTQTWSQIQTMTLTPAPWTAPIACRKVFLNPTAQVSPTLQKRRQSLMPAGTYLLVHQ